MARDDEREERDRERGDRTEKKETRVPGPCRDWDVTRFLGDFMAEMAK